MKDYIIYGAGQTTKHVIADIIYTNNKMPAAFVVDDEFYNNKTYYDLPVVCISKVKEIYPPDKYDMLIVSGRQVMRNREKMYVNAKSLSYHLINYISPNAIIEHDVEMGDNNIILSGVFIGFGGKIGSNNIIRHKVYIGHESIIGDHNIITSNCTIGGLSKIGNLSYIGLATTMKDRSIIGDECLIGMGSVVTKEIEPYSTAYGVPAKVASQHKETGIVFDI